jgi:GNAT superfamily N-acetyltransferase
VGSARIDPRVTYEDGFFHMVRDGFDDVPDFALPAGYRFRPFCDSDDAVWTALQRAAEPFFDIAEGLFEEQYGAHRAALPQRMWFVETDAGQSVASISAWWENEPPTPQDRGRIHWVVVHPEHQGRGLSKAMMTKAMARLARSHSGAVLGTSSGRPWAVKVYLDFGFLPDAAELDKPEIRQAWRDVQSVIGHPALERFLARNQANHRGHTASARKTCD